MLVKPLNSLLLPFKHSLHCLIKACFVFLLLAIQNCAFAADTSSLFLPTFTTSVQRYQQPHAVWLSADDAVGDNLKLLKTTLKLAEQQHKAPELVVYSIPHRDMGQSSAGGFKTDTDYLKDNALVIEQLKKFVRKTTLTPRIYLEPDAIAHAITAKKLGKTGIVGLTPDALYSQRIGLLKTLVTNYTAAGCAVFLDAAHSGWFDYADSDLQAMAQALNQIGMAQAQGVVTNVSNRQTVAQEAHYILRLRPLLDNASVRVVVDTSRNGNQKKPPVFQARQYTLADGGDLLDNEPFSNNRRIVGTWARKPDASLWVYPFFGDPKPVGLLVEKDYYSLKDSTTPSVPSLLTAPPWLDSVGDIQLGPAPTNTTGVAGVDEFRYVKPPDEGDGSLNYPPGESRRLIDSLILRINGR